MATLLKIGPADHNRPLTLEEFLNACGQEGYHYELIGGKLYVSPLPNAPQGLVERWIYRLLDRYAGDHPEVINFVYGKTRVFVPGAGETTVPEPDVAAYRDFPAALPLDEVRWQDVSPLVVVEVLSEDDPDKDLVRNVELYRQVPSIQEYWILDARASATWPSFLVYRRRDRRRWRKLLTIEPGSTYTTDLFPGFRLTVAPSI